jgi:hypothetical protein
MFPPPRAKLVENFHKSETDSTNVSILLIGANHTSAPVSFRERLAFSDEESEAALAQMVSSGLVQR